MRTNMQPTSEERREVAARVTFNKLTTVGGLGHYDLLTTVGGLGHYDLLTTVGGDRAAQVHQWPIWCGMHGPHELSHERPDSWERIAAELDEMVDASDSSDDRCEKFADLADRIRKLAEKEGK